MMQIFGPTSEYAQTRLIISDGTQSLGKAAQMKMVGLKAGKAFISSSCIKDMKVNPYSGNQPQMNWPLYAGSRLILPPYGTITDVKNINNSNKSKDLC